MKKREKKDIWNGLYEFYLIETKKNMEPDQLPLPSFITGNNNAFLLKNVSGSFRHLLTHQNINVVFYEYESTDNKIDYNHELDGYRLYDLGQIEELPKPILIERYLREKII